MAAPLAAGPAALASPPPMTPVVTAAPAADDVTRHGNTYYLSDNRSQAAAKVVTYGRPDDLVYVGDWDGDGIDTLAVRRGDTFHFSNSLTGGPADVVVTYGRPQDEILVGDWDGDGTDTLAVRRGSTYHVKNSLRGGTADSVVRYGRGDDVVLIGDWDGDGRDTFAVRRGFHYYVNNTMTSGPATTVVCFGRNNDEVYTGDWNGSGDDSLAVRRSSQYFLSEQLRSGPAERSVRYGRPDDISIVGDWDGDGTDSLGIRRATSGVGNQPGPVEPPTEEGFTEPLAIPPLADSRVDEDGTRVFELTAQEGTMSFHPGEETSTWGFNGDFLGPTLRARQGEQVAVEFTNAIDETTSVHWHGMHLPPEMDGGPHQEVEPGGTWRPTWLIDQPAATLWYHPHPHGLTEKHVYRGLSGMFILDDATSDASGLPQEYGVDDIPLIVQDKDFDEDGELTLVSPLPSGVMGKTIMVNGTVGAVQEVTTERVRLRLLNGSTLRSYNFGFDDNRSFQLVATDGGLLEEPHETNRIQLTPAERAEIVVELEPGEDIMLRSYPQRLGVIADPEGYGTLQTRDILRLQAADELAPSTEIAEQLSDYERLSEADATVTRHFEMENLRLNGQLMDMSRIDEVVTVGTTEIWEITNLDSIPHNFHIHDVQFEVLSIDGAAPPPELAGRKDTIYTEPQREYRLIMRFENYTSAEFPYMYHCHLLRHEDFGLMGQFLVLEPGAEPPTDLPDTGHHHADDGGGGGADEGGGGADDDGGGAVEDDDGGADEAGGHRDH
ncbi:multicopper oxidase family protein [Georgenia sp. MJ170]|uniref:multicopper oxidase family protein n=1 Tax=Georgenia sunbinii TaxID=3117728 RepID=UPI002F26B8A2